MEKTGISLVAIVKNEDRRIKSFLTHHRPLYDEAIIVDTGSTDNTISIAQDLGARVSTFAWCDDFSAARNASLEKATSKFALCIDADEKIAISDFPKLVDLVKAPEKCYLLPQRNYYNDSRHSEWLPVQGEYPEEELNQRGYFVAQNAKFFPINKRIRFKGRIHEDVIQSAHKINLPVTSVSIPIHHYGYVISKTHNESRNTLYSKLLRLKYEDSPNDAQTIQEYAFQLIQDGNYREAIPLMESLNQSKTTNSHITRARLMLGTLYINDGRIREARNLYQNAVQKDKNALFAHIELIKFLASQNDFGDQGKALEEAIRRFGEHPLLLKEQCRYLISTRQIHEAARVTHRVAELFPHLTEYKDLALKCDALAAKVDKSESTIDE